MGKIFMFVFVVLVGWLVITLSDELGITNSGRWFNGGGESSIENEVGYIIIRWDEYFTYNNGEWKTYTPPKYGENYVSQVVWTQWNWLVGEIKGENISFTHYKQ